MQESKPDDYDSSVIELKIITGKILESQTRMQRDIQEIKLNLFEPDKGLYMRVGRNTAFRLTASKWLWILTTGLLASLIHGVFRFLLH